jgi:tRNA (guanine37-N1)-methyltransferase
MKFKVITLFPDFINRLKEYSIIGRAINDKKIYLETINLRDFGLGSYKQVDDKPYGGGVGMLLRIDVLYRAIKKAAPRKSKKRLIVLLSADGEKFDQKMAQEFSKLDELVLICGHYEGVDKRVEDYIDKKLSFGESVLTGGEIPAMALIDSTSRLLSGVLGKDESSIEETFSEIDGKKILEYPQYTRPFDFKGKKVPDVLLSGNHKKITKWREKNTSFTS